MTKPWKHNCKERGELSKRRGGAGSFEAMTSKTMIKWAALKRTQKKKKMALLIMGLKIGFCFGNWALSLPGESTPPYMLDTITRSPSKMVAQWAHPRGSTPPAFPHWAWASNCPKMPGLEQRTALSSGAMLVPFVGRWKQRLLIEGRMALQRVTSLWETNKTTEVGPGEEIKNGRILSSRYNNVTA